jgi:glycerophosphoryl diester phosphodiesterase
MRQSEIYPRPVLRWLALVTAAGLCGMECQAAEFDFSAATKQVAQIVAHRGASAERPECTLAAIQRAIEVGATAVEVDVRTSRDGQLFLLHDAPLDRTTNGKGPANALTLAELQSLDAGSFFDPAYRGERIPSLIEAAKTCRFRIDILLDLKEQGADYDRKVAAVIRKHGSPEGTIVGVRSVEQATRFRQLLPEARQLALIPSLDTIEAFAEAGVETIRLWPRWLTAGDDPVKRIRAAGARLHLNGTMGELDETLELLRFGPDSLLSDHPARLKTNLARIERGDHPAARLARLASRVDEARSSPDESRVGARTFLNRDYEMLELPDELKGLPRFVFNGGEGGQPLLRFRVQTVVFAAFGYNDTGAWSFESGKPPSAHGWHLWRKDAYRGSSNAHLKQGNDHRASIWFREFKAGDELWGLPPWWLCLGITDLKTAKAIAGFRPGLVSNTPTPVRPYSHSNAAASIRPLSAPKFNSVEELRAWQTGLRKRFIERMPYPYKGKVAITPGPTSGHKTHKRREFHVQLDGRRLFRFFRLEPIDAKPDKPLPTVVCFMGHGKVAQILDEPDSYQHACAAAFAKDGYLVFAMENIGMEPGTDTHLDLDQSLRLEGHGWYSLLFAHQRILLDRVSEDPQVDARRVGVTGVSTGGLLALSAAVMEPRIAAASVQGIFGSMRTSFIRDRHRHCKCGAIPGLLPEFDLPELALLVAPRPLHISNGKTDGFSPAEAKRCVDLIEPLYRKAGGKGPRITVSPGGHEFALKPALVFFQEHLRPVD